MRLPSRASCREVAPFAAMSRYLPRSRAIRSRLRAIGSRFRAICRDFAPPGRDFAPPGRDFMPSCRDFAPVRGDILVFHELHELHELHMSLAKLLLALRPLLADPQAHWPEIVALLDRHKDLAEYEVARFYVSQPLLPPLK